MSANFIHLRGYDEQLFRLGVLAERNFPEDPNTTVLKLRRLEWEGVLEPEVWAASCPRDACLRRTRV